MDLDPELSYRAWATSLGRAMAKRSISTEPFLWTLFGARGLLTVLRHPLTRIVPLALRVLASFHRADRFGYRLREAAAQGAQRADRPDLLRRSGGRSAVTGFLLGPIPR